MAARSWLDIMAEDSNISMASITSITSNDQILTTSSKSKDPEFDNSKQGVNLLFNKNVIICDDSQSRKRTFKEMESQQTKHQQLESNKENHKFLLPKAKQRTNVNGDFQKRKNENINVSNNKIGFGRFLNWANNDSSNNDNGDNKKILGNKMNDNERNISHINNNGNNGSNSNSKLIICGSSINQNRGRRRKQIRARRNNKKNISNANEENVDKTNNKTNNMTKIIEEEEEHIINQNDDDIDVEIIDAQSVKEINNESCTKPLNQNVNQELVENQEKEQKDDIQKDEEKEEKQELSQQVKTKEIEEEKQDIKDDEKQRESDEDEDDDIDNDDIDNDGEEDDDLKMNNNLNIKSVPISSKTKQRRITPTLENVVFDTNLILNKVPILKKKSNIDSLNGPIFLNADQYEKLNVNQMEKEKAKQDEPRQQQQQQQQQEEEEEDDEEEEVEDYDCDVWGKNSLINDDKINNKSQSWANKLFGSQIKQNKKLKQRQEEILINQRKEERKHEMKIESLLPPSTLPTISKSMMFSRESSVSINTDNSSSISTPMTTITTTTTTTTTICKPSTEATEWREKQILIGKNTIGYKNFNNKHPNKELKFRTSNKFLMTPDAKDKVGKKRWVGKYQKWRKFLHFFDSETDDKATNDDNNDNIDDIDI